MDKLGQDMIRESGLVAYFKLANPDTVAVDALQIRLGDALRTREGSLSGFQKEALVRAARSAETSRLVADEGPYLNGNDAAPCPLAVLSARMVASFMNEILALAEIRGFALRKLRLVLENSRTMTGSMRDRTTADGAENIALKVEIDCDLDDAALQQFLVEAIHAAPLGGLMRGRSRACSSSPGTAVTCPPTGRPSSAAKLRAPRRTRRPAVPIDDAIGGDGGDGRSGACRRRVTQGGSRRGILPW